MTLDSNLDLLRETYNLLNSYRKIYNRGFESLSKLQRLGLRWPALRVLPFVKEPNISFKENQEQLIRVERRLHEIEEEIESRKLINEVGFLLKSYAEKLRHRSMSLREQCALLEARKSGAEEYYFEGHPYISSDGLSYTTDTSYGHFENLRSSHWEIHDKCIRTGRKLNDALDDPPDYFRNEYGVSDAFKEEFGIE